MSLSHIGGCENLIHGGRDRARFDMPHRMLDKQASRFGFLLNTSCSQYGADDAGAFLKSKPHVKIRRGTTCKSYQYQPSFYRQAREIFPKVACPDEIENDVRPASARDRIDFFRKRSVRRNDAAIESKFARPGELARGHGRRLTCPSLPLLP